MTALLASGFAILLWGANAALARPTLSGPELLIDSAHFRVHYTTSGADATTAANAQTLSSNAEKGYSAEVTQWQFPAPLPDGSLGGDSRTDIYVSASVSPCGVAPPDTNNNSTSGLIDLNPTCATVANVVEHELFHLIQYTHFLYPANWIREGTAEWASTHIEGTSPFYLYQYFTRPFVPLNCSSTSSPDGGNCGGSFRDDAYGRNTFWEYLSERQGFGEGIIKDVVIGEPTTSLTPANALDGVNDALSKHGTTLAQAFLDFTTANVSGNYTLAGLAGRTPVPDSTISTGTADASYPAQSFTVDHLAARYMRYEAARSSCHSATLHLSVTGPAGLASRPVFFDGDGHGPYLPTVNGGRLISPGHMRRGRYAGGPQRQPHTGRPAVHSSRVAHTTEPRVCAAAGAARSSTLGAGPTSQSAAHPTGEVDRRCKDRGRAALEGRAGDIPCAQRLEPAADQTATAIPPRPPPSHARRFLSNRSAHPGNQEGDRDSLCSVGIGIRARFSS